jgi:hypothetical protein
MAGASASTVEPMTAPVDDGVDQTTPRRSRMASVRRRLGPMASPTSPALVYLGVLLIVLAFAVIAYTWSRVAGTAIVVLQLPYVVSGGFAAVALLVIGALFVHLGAKRRDAYLRDRRLEQLAATLDALSTEADDTRSEQ